jgi:hypothetical protein
VGHGRCVLGAGRVAVVGLWGGLLLGLVWLFDVAFKVLSVIIS